MYRNYLIIFVIGLLLFVGSRWHLTAPLQDTVKSLIEPVLASETTVGQKSFGFFSVLASIRSLATENTTQKQRIEELQSQLIELKEVKHENESLRNELNIATESKKDFLPARLIGRTSTGIIKDLIINRGERDDVRVTQPVMSGGFLIGIVTSVNAKSATVRLITHPRSLIPVITQDSRSTGLLRGGISGLTVTDLLIDVPVSPNEALLTSGIGEVVPAGLPIGTIIDSVTKKGDITKKATVSLPIDINKLETVFVRKESLSPL